MRKRNLFPVVLLCIFVFTLMRPADLPADDRRTDKSSLVIMTLNAEFLWDGVKPEEGRVNFPWKNSKTRAETHMRKVAELIIRSNPDIVNLVEVENLAALKTFNSKFLAGRGYRPYLIDGRDSYTGEDVALLTRIDPENFTIKRTNRTGRSENTKKTVSKNYYAKITVGDLRIGLIGLHLLAIPSNWSRKPQREAQADAIRSLARDLQGQGFNLIIFGDFNDYDGEESCRDHIDSKPITNVLRLIRRMVPSSTSDDLVNAARFLPKDNRYTAFYDANGNGRADPPREFTSIDHVLLSPKLAAKVTAVLIPHKHDPLRVTDHFPVVVHLQLEGG